MTRDEKERALKGYAIVKETDRKMPDSLRHLLHDLICDRFERKPNVAAEQFRSLLRRANEQRDFRTRSQAISASSLLHVVKGRQQISYSLMDAMAQTLHIPAGLMLLFTRARSDVANKKRTEEALRVVRSTQRALAKLETQLHLYEGVTDIDTNRILSNDFFNTLCVEYDDHYNQTLL